MRTISVVDYDLAWPAQFDAESKLLHRTLGHTADATRRATVQGGRPLIVMHKKSVLLVIACAVILSNARSAANDSAAAKTFSETVKRQRVAAIGDLTRRIHAADRLEIENLMVPDSAAKFGMEKDGKMVWKDLPKPIQIGRAHV